MSSIATFLWKLEDCHCKGHVSIFLFLRGGAGRSSYFFFFIVQAHTIDVTLMMSQLRLIRMLIWHHESVIRGTWNVFAACWRALDACRHIQAHGEHMKTREKEGRYSVGAWNCVTTPV